MLVRQTQAQRTKPRALPRNQLEQHNVCGLESSVARMEETTTQGPLEVAPAIRHSPRSLVVNAVKAGSFGLGHASRRFVAECAHLRHSSQTYMAGTMSTGGAKRADIDRQTGEKLPLLQKGRVPSAVDREGWCHKVAGEEVAQ